MHVLCSLMMVVSVWFRRLPVSSSLFHFLPSRILPPVSVIRKTLCKSLTNIVLAHFFPSFLPPVMKFTWYISRLNASSTFTPRLPLLALTPFCMNTAKYPSQLCVFILAGLLPSFDPTHSTLLPGSFSPTLCLRPFTKAFSSPLALLWSKRLIPLFPTLLYSFLISLFPNRTWLPSLSNGTPPNRLYFSAFLIPSSFSLFPNIVSVHSLFIPSFPSVTPCRLLFPSFPHVRGKRAVIIKVRPRFSFLFSSLDRQPATVPCSRG